jgi:hypothetical protein
MVEKNDVSLAPLFHWNKRFELADLNEATLEVFVRLVGDAELNKARVFALRKSSELRRDLKNESSDVRLAFISESEGLTRGQLQQLVLTLSIRDVTQDALRQVRLPYPKEPDSEASLEAQEKHQELVDNYPKEKEIKLREFITNSMTKIKETLDSTSDEELYNIYERAIIGELCEQEMLRSFGDMCAFFGCYKDKNFSERYFADVEEFQNLSSVIKEQFLSAYKSLELSSEDLKKLPGATQ